MSDVAYVLLCYEDIDIVRVRISEAISSFESMRIIVIDNSSSSHGRQFLAEFPDVVYEHQVINGGYTAGNNRGIKIAKELGCRFALVANPDVSIAELRVGELVQILKDSGFFAVSPFGYSPVGFLEKNIGFILGVKGVVYKYEAKAIFESRSFWGAAFICDVNLFEAIGGFDERLFMYVEEQDLSARALRRGYKVGFTESCGVVNRRLDDYSVGKDLYWYLVSRNLVWFFKKNFGAVWFLLFFVCIMRFYMRLLSLSRRRWHCSVLVFRGIVSGIKGQTGKPCL